VESNARKESTEYRVPSTELKEKTASSQKTRWAILRWTMVFIIALVITGVASAQNDIDLSTPSDTSFNPQSEFRNPQSKRRAILLSLALPGLGEAYAGNWDRARAFFITEGITWTSFTAFRVYGGWRADDYRVYSAEHAAVRLAGQPDSFFRDIGSFSGSEVFNTQQLLTQREKAQVYTGVNTWIWDKEASRKAYLDIRRSSRRARVRSVYLIGFAILTRVVSAIDAGRIIDGRSPSIPNLNMYIPPDGSIRMALGYRF